MTQIELRIDSGQIGAVFRAVLLACKHSNRITIEQTKRTAAAIVLQGKRETGREKEKGSAVHVEPAIIKRIQ